MSEREVSVPVGEHLRREYLKRVERNSGYSLRAFSRDLEVSHSHLSRLISGKRNLSLRQALEISQRISMETAQKRKFLDDVTLANSQPLNKKISAKGRDPRLRKFLTLEVDQFRVVSEWHHSAILELLGVKGFEPKHTWVAQRLGISSRRVRAAVNRLKRLGLLEVSETRWTRTHTHLIVPSGASGAVRAFHRQMIEKASEALQNDNPEIRDITGTTIALDPSRLPEIKNRIRKFRKSLMDFAAGENVTELYQLNVQFFTLLKGNTKRKGSRL